MKMKRMVRRLVGFDNDDDDDERDGIPGWSVAVFCFSFLFFPFLFFLLFFPFLSPAHIRGEKSGSMGSTH